MPASTTPQPSRKETALKARVFADLVDFLYAQSASGRFTPTICFSVCAPLFLIYTPWWTFVVILAAQLGGTAFCEVLRRRHAATTPEESARAYVVGSAVCGVSWGLAGALWFVADVPEMQVLLVVLLIGGVTGSLISRSPHLPALYAFVAMAGLPFIAVLVFTGTLATYAMAALAALYALAIIGWARGLNAMYVREATARLSNHDLLKDVKAAQHEAERRADEAEAARHAAEAGERAKMQFLSVMSHEVRTPLNGIQGMSGLLTDTDLTDDQRECVDVIRKSSDSLRLILEDVIDLAQLDTGSAAFDRQPFAPEEIARQVATILEPEARRKKLDLDVYVAPDVPASVVGDEQRCRQVLLNLAGNAVKFTDCGRVLVRISLEPLSGSADEECLRFAVRDTGIGIAADDLNLLFKEFSQVDQSETRRHGGGGLGLALAQRIVSQMSGDVGVRSTPGEGSEFWFDIPLQEAAGKPVTPEHSADLRTLDPGKVIELCRAIGPVRSNEIVESCLDVAWKLTETIEAARRNQDIAAIGRAAHDLKSAAGNIGLVALAGKAAILEAAARCGDTAVVLDEASRVPGETAAANNAVSMQFPQLMAGAAIQG